MTPTRLRAFSAVVRLGSVKEAAAELGVTEAAVSLHVSQLRKELEDRLFVRTAAGLAFIPGGLRLASRATELLGRLLGTLGAGRPTGALAAQRPAATVATTSARAAKVFAGSSSSQ